MKYEELIDFTQKILEANYLPVYRFELPCEDLDHLDQTAPPYSGRKKYFQIFQ